MPLDFVYQLDTDSYRLDFFNTDEKLLKKVQTGVGDPQIYQNTKFLFLEGFVAETLPAEID